MVPAYNEAERIGDSLHELRAHLSSRPYGVELVVVDDGSTDDTLGVISRETESWPFAVRILRYVPNRGKGHALKAGFEVARGAQILFSDADLSTPITELEKLRARLSDGCDIAIGTRKTETSKIRIRQPFVREQMGRVFTWLVRCSIGEVSDVTCGFKLFRAEVGRALFSYARTAGWSFDAELFALVRARGYALGEVPVAWADRSGTKVRIVTDAIGSLVALARILWRRRCGAYEHATLPIGAPTVFENAVARSAGPHHTETASASAHSERQRAFYASGRHHHLRVAEHDLYAEKIVRYAFEAMGIARGARVLEVGAGFGRFTFPLLSHCDTVVALDLCARSLEALDAVRRARGISGSRCETICADLDTVAPERLGRFDVVVGFFFLHHVEDSRRTLAKVASLVEPGGRACFVEPNRWNPAFALQVACCPDMHLREEAGMFRLGARRIERELAAVGLDPGETLRFGFFPPQIANRSAAARRLEARLEAIPALWPLLPFLALHGKRGAT